MVTSAEALELLEGPLACLYRASRPHGPSLSGPGEFQVEEALRLRLGLGDGLPAEARAERWGGLLSSGPASAGSPAPLPRPAHDGIPEHRKGLCWFGPTSISAKETVAWGGVGYCQHTCPDSPGSQPAGALLPPGAACGIHLEAGSLPPLGGPFPKMVQVSCLPPSPWSTSPPIQDRPWGVRETF